MPSLTLHSYNFLADGYVRSESVVAIFMQKSTDARRIYATLVNAKVNIDGSKVKGIVFPSREAQKKLIQDVYAEADVNLHDVAFVECHATGTRVRKLLSNLLLRLNLVFNKNIVSFSTPKAVCFFI